MDYAAGQYRGFCFVEFEDSDDAAEAIFNMDGGELLGRTIRASVAQPNQVNKFSSAGGGGADQAIWKSDEWFQTHVVGGQDEASKKREQEKAQDVKTLQDL